MGPLPQDIESLVKANKTLGATPNWDDTSDPMYAYFTFPLTVDGVATGGFQLRVKVSKRWIDRDCMAQLEFAPAGKRTEIPLWRAEWRPLSPHTNKKFPQEFAYQEISGSHQHTFDDNFNREQHKMREPNLPAARPLQSDVNTLSEFLACIGQLFKINDVERIQPPGIGPDLFWMEK